MSDYPHPTPWRWDAERRVMSSADGGIVAAFYLRDMQAERILRAVNSAAAAERLLTAVEAWINCTIREDDAYHEIREAAEAFRAAQGGRSRGPDSIIIITA